MVAIGDRIAYKTSTKDLWNTGVLAEDHGGYIYVDTIFNTRELVFSRDILDRVGNQITYKTSDDYEKEDTDTETGVMYDINNTTSVVEDIWSDFSPLEQSFNPNSVYSYNEGYVIGIKDDKVYVDDIGRRYVIGKEDILPIDEESMIHNIHDEPYNNDFVGVGDEIEFCTDGRGRVDKAKIIKINESYPVQYTVRTQYGFKFEVDNFYIAAITKRSGKINVKKDLEIKKGDEVLIKLIQDSGVIVARGRNNVVVKSKHFGEMYMGIDDIYRINGKYWYEGR